MRPAEDAEKQKIPETNSASTVVDAQYEVIESAGREPSKKENGRKEPTVKREGRESGNDLYALPARLWS